MRRYDQTLRACRRLNSEVQRTFQSLHGKHEAAEAVSLLLMPQFLILSLSLSLASPSVISTTDNMQMKTLL